MQLIEIQIKECFRKFHKISQNKKLFILKIQQKSNLFKRRNIQISNFHLMRQKSLFQTYQGSATSTDQHPSAVLNTKEQQSTAHQHNPSKDSPGKPPLASRQSAFPSMQSSKPNNSQLILNNTSSATPEMKKQKKLSKMSNSFILQQNKEKDSKQVFDSQVLVILANKQENSSQFLTFINKFLKVSNAEVVLIQQQCSQKLNILNMQSDVLYWILAEENCFVQIKRNQKIQNSDKSNTKWIVYGSGSMSGTFSSGQTPNAKQGSTNGRRTLLNSGPVNAPSGVTVYSRSFADLYEIMTNLNLAKDQNVKEQIQKRKQSLLMQDQQVKKTNSKCTKTPMNLVQTYIVESSVGTFTSDQLQRRLREADQASDEYKGSSNGQKHGASEIQQTISYSPRQQYMTSSSKGQKVSSPLQSYSFSSAHKPVLKGNQQSIDLSQYEKFVQNGITVYRKRKNMQNSEYQNHQVQRSFSLYAENSKPMRTSSAAIPFSKDNGSNSIQQPSPNQLQNEQVTAALQEENEHFPAQNEDEIEQHEDMQQNRQSEQQNHQDMQQHHQNMQQNHQDVRQSYQDLQKGAQDQYQDQFMKSSPNPSSIKGRRLFPSSQSQLGQRRTSEQVKEYLDEISSMSPDQQSLRASQQFVPVLNKPKPNKYRSSAIQEKSRSSENSNRVAPASTHQPQKSLWTVSEEPPQSNKVLQQSIQKQEAERQGSENQQISSHSQQLQNRLQQIESSQPKRFTQNTQMSRSKAPSRFKPESSNQSQRFRSISGRSSQNDRVMLSQLSVGEHSPVAQQPNTQNDYGCNCSQQGQLRGSKILKETADKVAARISRSGSQRESIAAQVASKAKQQYRPNRLSDHRAFSSKRPYSSVLAAKGGSLSHASRNKSILNPNPNGSTGSSLIKPVQSQSSQKKKQPLRQSEILISDTPTNKKQRNRIGSVQPNSQGHTGSQTISSYAEYMFATPKDSGECPVRYLLNPDAESSQDEQQYIHNETITSQFIAPAQSDPYYRHYQQPMVMGGISQRQQDNCYLLNSPNTMIGTGTMMNNVFQEAPLNSKSRPSQNEKFRQSVQRNTSNVLGGGTMMNNLFQEASTAAKKRISTNHRGRDSTQSNSSNIMGSGTMMKNMFQENTQDPNRRKSQSQKSRNSRKSSMMTGTMMNRMFQQISPNIASSHQKDEIDQIQEQSCLKKDNAMNLSNLSTSSNYMPKQNREIIQTQQQNYHNAPRVSSKVQQWATKAKVVQSIRTNRYSTVEECDEELYQVDEDQDGDSQSSSVQQEFVSASSLSSQLTSTLTANEANSASILYLIDRLSPNSTSIAIQQILSSADSIYTFKTVKQLKNQIKQSQDVYDLTFVFSDQVLSERDEHKIRNRCPWVYFVSVGSGKKIYEQDGFVMKHNRLDLRSLSCLGNAVDRILELMESRQNILDDYQQNVVQKPAESFMKDKQYVQSGQNTKGDYY